MKQPKGNSPIKRLIICAKVSIFSEFIAYYLLECNHLILNLGSGGKMIWIGDGFCDDANNIEECNYDGGDCCGIDVQNNFCVNCTCTGRCKLTLSIGDL